jgi:hypothetical protein
MTTRYYVGCCDRTVAEIEVSGDHDLSVVQKNQRIGADSCRLWSETCRAGNPKSFVQTCASAARVATGGPSKNATPKNRAGTCTQKTWAGIGSMTAPS